MAMRFVRQINIHLDDIQRLNDFLNQRDLSVRVAWATTTVSGSGIAGRMEMPIPGKGTISGDLSEADAAELNALISELEDGYWRPRG
jgi:hypothetical protein